MQDKPRTSVTGVLIPLLSILACATASARERVLFDAGSATDLSAISCLVPDDGTTFALTNGVLRIETPGGRRPHGVTLAGNWDLSGFTTLKADVRETTRGSTLPLMMRAYAGDYKPTWRILPGAGVRDDVGRTWKSMTLHLPPSAPNARACAAQITDFRGTPFTAYGLQGNYDPARTERVALHIAVQPQWKWTIEVRRIVATDELPPMVLPDYCALPPEKFFPCIDRYGQFKYRDWPGKTHSDADLKAAAAREAADLAAHPGPAGRDRWGGWAAGPRRAATGSFRVEKVDGKWWFVDPDGCLWWSHGPVRVTPSASLTMLEDRKGRDQRFFFEELPAAGSPFALFYETCDALLKRYYGTRKTYDHSSANACRKYGADWFAAYADLAHRRLKSWGMNTIANSSDVRICLMDRTPYTDRCEIRGCKAFKGGAGQWYTFKDPYDPSFRDALRRELANHARELADPWCFGFFVDNELHWGQGGDLARWALDAGDGYPACARAKAALAVRGVTPATAKDADLLVVSAMIADEYYRVVRDEFKKAAPQKLYMGSRFAGNAPEFVLRAAGRYCDIVSFNIYGRDISARRLPAGIDRPIIVGEFHMGALDRGLFAPGLVELPNQEERGKAYTQYVNSALVNPYVVGVHWHQFGDQATMGRFDGENFQVGLVDVCDTPYPETVAGIRAAGYPMYETRYNACRGHRDIK